jgi:hypothetical protein
MKMRKSLRRDVELVLELTLVSAAGAIAGVIAYNFQWLPGVPQPFVITLGVWVMLLVQRWIAPRRVVADAPAVDSGTVSAHPSDQPGSTIKQDVLELVAGVFLLGIIAVICELVGRDRHWPPGLSHVVGGTLSTPISVIVGLRIWRRRRERASHGRRSL